MPSWQECQEDFPGVLVQKMILHRRVAKAPVCNGVVARSDNFVYEGDIDRIKLEDGIQLHREKKALLEEYTRNHKLKTGIH
jgi:hypothetical protein